MQCQPEMYSHVEGIDHPNEGGLPEGLNTEARVRDTALQVDATILWIDKMPVSPKGRSQNPTIRKVGERRGFGSDSPCLRSQ